MAHGLDGVETATVAASPADAAGLADRILRRINQLIVLLSSIALVIAAFVLTYSVASRYFFHFSTDWQDELSVFLIVGAVFMSSAAIQAAPRPCRHRGDRRPAARRGRTASARSSSTSRASLFCGFFAWKSWTLLDEAWIENHHSGSTWGPPLWIPYSLMTIGMTLLSVQLLLQVIAQLRARATARHERALDRPSVRRRRRCW
mgnify:CR=1 FL=1